MCSRARPTTHTSSNEDPGHIGCNADFVACYERLHICYNASVAKSAPLAQLDRASGYEPEGREFESPRARHYLCLRPRKQKSNHRRSLFCSMNHGEESPVCASVLRTKLLPWASEPIQRSVASVRIVTISKP